MCLHRARVTRARAPRQAYELLEPGRNMLGLATAGAVFQAVTGAPSARPHARARVRSHAATHAAAYAPSPALLNLVGAFPAVDGVMSPPDPRF